MSRPYTVAALAAVALMASGCAVGTTGFPDAVAVDSARVLGEAASSSGGSASYWVEYGSTPAYGSKTAAETASVTQGTPLDVTVTVAGLARDTAYHYRLCARDSQGGACGADRTLRTQDVACGQTVTEDVRLTGDLDCDFDPLGPVESPNGLVVGADGIDVDLGGHGIGGGVNVGGSGVRGIDNTGGFDNVTIRNGGVGGWGVGVELEGATGNVLRRFDAQGSPTGMRIAGGAFNAVHGGALAGRLNGLLVASSPGTTVDAAAVDGAFGTGLSIAGDSVRVSDSRIGTSVGYALEISGAGNSVLHSEVGARPGFFGPFGGILVGGGTENRLIGNTVTGVDAPVAGEEGDGIRVAATAAGTTIRLNVASDNQGDGIDVDDATARLGGNVANSNTDLGIEAAAGVTDLGGNAASGNGNPLQCLNVFCR
ncbi:MAG: right-handed parallel beta-helix repeat-containing protein [Thermoleophilaceae bacterium]|nr:right-handed parallel beta-helix repeat-containing protein [Thermoleophilaceae bacterium]